jgi:phosphohistidine phosphatase
MTHQGEVGARTLVLVRHAKSRQNYKNVADHDRPLNDRGERDAPYMAERLARRGPRPDRIISSSALRALATAEEFLVALELEADAMVVTRSIYEAGASELITLVSDLDNDLKCVIVVGHNPTLTDVANTLATEPVGELPTCSVVTLALDSGTWADAKKGAFRLVDFDFPKRGDGHDSSEGAHRSVT